MCELQSYIVNILVGIREEEAPVDRVEAPPGEANRRRMIYGN